MQRDPPNGGFQPLLPLDGGIAGNCTRERSPTRSRFSRSRLIERTFIPIESNASRCCQNRTFPPSLMNFSSLFDTLFFSRLSLFRTRSCYFRSLVGRSSIGVQRFRGFSRVRRLGESRSAIRMKAFLKAVSYLCRCPHYGATRREHSSSSSACRGPEQRCPPLNIEKEIRARTGDTLSFLLSVVRRPSVLAVHSSFCLSLLG